MMLQIYISFCNKQKNGFTTCCKPVFILDLFLIYFVVDYIL